MIRVCGLGHGNFIGGIGHAVRLTGAFSLLRLSAAEKRRSPGFALGCRSSTSCARVCIQGGGHAIYVLRGFGLPTNYASSPRALMACLFPAADARGGNEGVTWVFGG